MESLLSEEPSTAAVADDPSRSDHDSALRHAGIVVMVLGVLVGVGAIVWNQTISFPERSDLEIVEGRLERIHLESFRSRTAATRWFVFDVMVESDGGEVLDHWLLPDFSVRFEEPLVTLEAGDEIRGWVEPEQKKVRGSEYPVKVLWILERDGVEVVPYALVAEVEQEAWHQPPLIGLLMCLIGLGLITLDKRMRAALHAHGNAGEPLPPSPPAP